TVLINLCSAVPGVEPATSHAYSAGRRELQSIGHGLLVTFCYRHRRPNRQGSPGHGTGICIRAEAPLANSSQVSGSVVQYQRGSPAWRHCPVPLFPPRGCTSVVWLPVWLPGVVSSANVRMPGLRWNLDARLEPTASPRLACPLLRSMMAPIGRAALGGMDATYGTSRDRYRFG